MPALDIDSRASAIQGIAISQHPGLQRALSGACCGQNTIPPLQIEIDQAALATTQKSTKFINQAP